MSIPLLAALLVLSAPQRADDPPAPRGPTVEGVIRGVEEGRRIPVPYAIVEVLGPDGRRTVMADSVGRYRAEPVPPGLRRLRAGGIGWETIEVDVLVPSSGAVDVDLVLRRRAVPLPALSVTTEPLAITDRGGEDAAGTGPLAGLVNLRALEASPGLVESGLGDAVRSLPGNEPRDPTDVLLMRGSTADLKLVLLDGAPVYAPFHTGGLLPGFQISTLGGAAHHVGGAPARYDGGLSYILDLRTRPARTDRLRASGSLDVMSLRGSVETPVGPRAGVLATGRALHDLAGRLAGGDGSPYGYLDGLVRVDAETGGEGLLSVTGFANGEAVRLDLPPSADSPGLEEASWGNEVLAAHWRRDVAGGWLDLGFARTSYRAELPVTLRDGGESGGSGASSVHVASGTTERTRVTADLSLPSVAEGLRVGAALDRTAVAYGTRSPSGSSPSNRSDGWLVGAYADGIRPLSDELDLRYGLRMDRFEPGGVKAAPRMAVLWTLSPDAVVTVAAGRYHQLVRLGDTEADLALGDALEVGTVPAAESVGDGLLRVATADHLTVALDQSVSPEVRLSFEGFLKRFRGLGASGSPELASSGADLRVVREGGSTTTWLGYSLAWFWEEGTGPMDFSGRHLLSAGFQGPVAGPVGIDLRASFSDGLPLTAVEFESVSPGSLGDSPEGLDSTPGARSPTRTDGFLRIDAEIFAQWTGDWGSRTMRIRPYLRVLNALDRRDALFYYFEPWRDDGLRPLAELSVIPVVGLEWRF